MLVYQHLGSLELICYSYVELGGYRTSHKWICYYTCWWFSSMEKQKAKHNGCSTMESKDIGCFETMRQGVWMKNLIMHIKVVGSVERKGN